MSAEMQAGAAYLDLRWVMFLIMRRPDDGAITLSAPFENREAALQFLECLVAKEKGNHDTEQMRWNTLENGVGVFYTIETVEKARADGRIMKTP